MMTREPDLCMDGRKLRAWLSWLPAKRFYIDLALRPTVDRGPRLTVFRL